MFWLPFPNPVVVRARHLQAFPRRDLEFKFTRNLWSLLGWWLWSNPCRDMESYASCAFRNNRIDLTPDLNSKLMEELLGDESFWSEKNKNDVIISIHRPPRNQRSIVNHVLSLSLSLAQESCLYIHVLSRFWKIMIDGAQKAGGGAGVWR